MHIKLLSGGGSGKRGYVSGGGGGGGASWLGTLNYVVKSGAATLADSQIYDDATNVGIGTNSPITKLHIRGASGTSIKETIQNTTVTASAYAGVTLISGTTANAGIRLYSAATVQSGGIYPSGLYLNNGIASGPVSVWCEGADAGSAIYFGTQNILRMTIDNVGTVISSVNGQSASMRLNRVDGNTNYLVFANNSVDKIWLQRESNNDFTIGTGIESIRCQQTTGYVGIHVPVPAQTLHMKSIVAFADCKIRTEILSLGGYWDVGSKYNSSTHKYHFTTNPGSGDIPVMSLDQFGVCIGSYANSALAPDRGLIVSGRVGIAATDPNGKLEIYVPKAATPLSIVFTMEDLAHGITTLLPTNAFGAILCGSAIGYSEGGLLVRGISTNPDSLYVPAVKIDGITVSGEGTPDCIVLNGAHKNGTGTDPVPDNNVILSISNNATVKCQVFGNGSLRIDDSGVLYVNHINNSTSLHAITFDYGINLSTVPFYANNAAALAGGLVSGDVYRTNADPDPLCIVH